ncbi:ER membrane glycoprotein subunit of the GPI transamidase complex-like protein, partial [Coemansia sp. Benny D115]
YAAISRVVALALGVASNALISDYDSSLSVALDVLPGTGAGADVGAGAGLNWAAASVHRTAQALAQVVVRWDAFYFVHIADVGYVYEQEHAFFPLLPLLMRLLASTLLAPLASMVGRQLALVVAGAVVSNTAFVLAAAVLYRLGRATLHNESLAYIAALLYAMAPSNMFMSAVYTESLLALLAFSALLLVKQRRLALASVCLGLGSLCRSNGAVYAGFIIWELVVSSGAWRRAAHGSLSVSQALAFAARLLKCAALVAVSLLGVVAFQLYGRRELCGQPLYPPDHPARPYCSGVLSTVYGFVQAEYWDVGFLRYYTLQQLPNFLLAAPMVALSAAGLCAYAAHDPLMFATLGWRRAGAAPAAGASAGTAFFGAELLPHVYLWALLLGVATTAMHVQVVTRFFSSVPAVFWFAAHLVADRSGGAAQGGPPGWRRWRRRAVVGFFAAYGLAGVVLFSNFFPPA